MAAIVEGRRRMGEAISEGRWQRQVDERGSAVADFVSVGGDGGRREAEGGRVDLEIGIESSIIELQRPIAAVPASQRLPPAALSPAWFVGSVQALSDLPRIFLSVSRWV
ncbi:hypothetical protein LXL04_038544 [Taraxacum kok-saghyz]